MSLVADERVSMSYDKAVELVDLLEILRNSLHAHALGVVTITPERADQLRRRIEWYERNA